MECNGSGQCLKQQNNGQYEETPNINCPHKCKGIKCPNYVLCKVIAPVWYFDCHAGMCTNCDIIFGKWANHKGRPQIQESIECPVCLETNQTGIINPNCNHLICIKCFKKLYWNDKEEEYLHKCPLCRQ